MGASLAGTHPRGWHHGQGPSRDPQPGRRDTPGDRVFAGVEGRRRKWDSGIRGAWGQSWVPPRPRMPTQMKDWGSLAPRTAVRNRTAFSLSSAGGGGGVVVVWRQQGAHMPPQGVRHVGGAQEKHSQATQIRRNLHPRALTSGLLTGHGSSPQPPAVPSESYGSLKAGPPSHTLRLRIKDE